MNLIQKLQHRAGVALIVNRANRKNKRYQRWLARPHVPSEFMTGPRVAYAPAGSEVVGGLVIAFLTAFMVNVLRVPT